MNGPQAGCLNSESQVLHWKLLSIGRLEYTSTETIPGQELRERRGDDDQDDEENDDNVNDDHDEEKGDTFTIIIITTVTIDC